MLTTVCPFNQYFDANGDPLDNGRLYFGTAGLDPETNPITVYWDEAATQPAAQPIRTRAGYPVRNGSTPARIYVNADDYSVTCRTSSGSLVFYERAVTADGNVRADLLDTSSASKGAGMVNVRRAASAVVRSLLEKINEISVSLEDFGGIGDDVTDNAVAFSLAMTYLGASGGTIKLQPGKVYRTSSLSFAGADYITIEGDGGKTQSSIRFTSTTGDFVDLANSRFATFRRLNFLPLSQKTAGALFKIPSTASDIYFEHVRVSSAYVGWDIDGTNVFFKHVECLDYNASWAWHKVLQIGNAAQAALIHIDDFIVSSQTTFTGPAIHVINVDTLIGNAVFVQKSGSGQMQGMQVDGGEFIQFTATHLEPGTTQDGVVVAGGTHVEFFGLHVTTAKRGVRVTGGKGISLHGGRLYYNAEEGARIEGGTGVMIDGVSVCDNSTSSAGTYDGVYVAAGVSDFQILGTRPGSVRGTPVQCRYSIYVADGTSNRYVVEGNTCTEYATGAVYDGGSGPDKSVRSNTGAKTSHIGTPNTLTTTDATVTTLWSHTLADEAAYYVRATVVGQASDTSVRFAYQRTCLVYRDGGGATIQGQSSLDTIESNAAMDCTFDASGNDVRLRVTGLAGTTLRWRASVDLVRSTQLI